MKFFSHKAKGMIYSILSGILYGSIGYLGMKIIDSGISIPTMQFWRFLVAALLVVPILICLKRSQSISLKELLKFLALGLFYGAGSAAYFLSSKFVGTGVAMVIFFTFPIFVLLLNYLLYKTRVSRDYYIALLIILIGMLLLADVTKGGLDFFGILSGVISAILYAIYVVYSNDSKLDALTRTMIVSFGCALACLIFAILDNSFAVPNEGEIWVKITLIALVCTTLPILLLLEAVKHISTEKASLLSILEPVCGVVIGVLFLGESLSLIQYIGVAITLVGATLIL